MRMKLNRKTWARRVAPLPTLLRRTSAKLGRNNAPRERIFMSSLPGLTRQSMREGRSLGFTALFDSLDVSMDHRLKPGGDEG
jgi:hypothetical protein